MAKDLRSFLDTVKEQLPDEYVEVDKEIDPLFEVTAVVQKLEDLNKYPMVLFNNVRNIHGKPGHKHLINLFPSRKRFALAFGLEPSQSKYELTKEIADRGLKLVKTQTIPQNEAPVRDVVHTGEAADLADLPIIKEHEMDGSYYTTMPVAVYKGPEAGYNSTHARMMYISKHEGRFLFAPFHTWQVIKENERKDKPTRAAVVLGHHPAYCVASSSRGAPFNVSEYEIAGGLLGEPLRVTASETWGSEFMVPADAEIIVEGEFLPNVRRAEGPFGEWHSYYGPEHSQGIVFNVKAITTRKDPIMITQFGGHRDHYAFLVGWEGQIFRKVREAVPTVKGVHVAPSGHGMHVYVSIKKMNDGDPKMAALAALTHGFPKLIVVVDDDIDIFNDDDVLWAMATRMQADERVEIIKGIKGSIIDPSMSHPYLHTAMIIDATKPSHTPFLERIGIPKDVMDRIKLEDYIPPEKIKRLE